MTAAHTPPREPGESGNPGEIRPLPGEPGIPDVQARARQPMSKKGLLAVALLLMSIAAVASFGLARLGAGGKKPEDAQSKLASNRPVATTTEPRKLELPTLRAANAAAAAPASAPRVPALVPTTDELAEPIGVRRTGAPSSPGGSPRPTLPEDAPVLLVTSRPGETHGAPRPAQARGEGPADAGAQVPTDPLAETRQNLDAYQRQLQGLLDNLTRSTTAALGTPAGALGQPSSGGPPTGALPPLAGGVPSAGLLGGSLQSSATPRVTASTLGNRSLVLPKGTAFTCALKTKVISAMSGLVGCQVQRNVYGDDGRVLLIERGSHLDGEYRIASVRPGTVRIPVLWTRVRTPHGVTVDIDSPGTGALGESGVDGHVDNRWGERIGAAMLLSLIDDSVKLIIQNQANESNADTIVLPSTTANTSKLAEKVLDSTINIPPLIYQNQGGIVGIYVARDVDFSSVYELKPVAR
jgi:type IV secretion system protein VirB10